MNPEDVLVADLVSILLVGTVAGLLVRSRGGLSVSFMIYMATAIVTNRLIIWWPERFFVHGFWVAKEAGYALLELAIALELAIRGLRSFPRARRLAIAAVGVIVAASIAAAIAAPAPDYEAQLSGAIATLGAGALWSFVALALIVAWFHLPLHQLHLALLVGWILDLAFYSGLLGAVQAFGWDDVYPYLAQMDPVFFAASVGIWTFAAWRPAEARALAGAPTWVQP